MLANCGVTDFRPDIAHFGTNRGTSGFNPVWTACDMIMNRNRIGSSRPGTRCDLLHFDADDRFQFGALACESVLQLACESRSFHACDTKAPDSDKAMADGPGNSRARGGYVEGQHHQRKLKDDPRLMEMVHLVADQLPRNLI
jgi:hypothetical protein